MAANLVDLPRRRWAVMLGAALLLAVGAASGWALRVVLHPTEASDASSNLRATVVQGSVSSSFKLNAAATWSTRATGVNRASGVVTSVDTNAGDLVAAGDVLYSVGLRPVVVAVGTVPSFRSIGPGSVGPDVAQLQRLLKTRGFYRGRLGHVADPAVVAAIKAWQKSLGVAQDGVVQPGDVLYVPALPARVTLDMSQVSVGGSLGGGEPVLAQLASEPTFEIDTTPAQAGQIEDGTAVQVSAPNGSLWSGTVTGRHASDDGQTVTLSLSGVDGAVLCGAACSQVPAAGRTLLPTTVVVVPETTGLVVPSTALTTTASGATQVVDAHGSSRPVHVVAAANGMSVITGVEEGLQVRLPRTADQ